MIVNFSINWQKTIFELCNGFSATIITECPVGAGSISIITALTYLTSRISLISILCLSLVAYNFEYDIFVYALFPRIPKWIILKYTRIVLK